MDEIEDWQPEPEGGADVAPHDASRPGSARPLLAELNPRQVEAVVKPGPLLVLAGPGSGKTRILTHRAAWLVAERAARPAQVLCVTFTNRAAEEMSVRLEALLGDAGRDFRIHTFHALCARIVRQYGAAVGLNPRFVVADENDQALVLTELMRKRELSLEEFPPYRIMAFIGEFKRELRDPGRASPSERIPPEFIDLAEDYDQILHARGLLDFDDLIVQTVRLLAKDRGVRTDLQRALPHVLVDEYQDINRAQFVLLQLLVPKGGDIFAVADDAQSIYGWRGAQPELIGAFQNAYRPLVVELDQSYRSTEAILYAAQNMLRRSDAPERQRRFMKTDQGHGEPIHHYIFATGHQEQAWLVRLVRRLVAERGYNYGDIAILYRTHHLADEIEGALLEAGVPVQRVRKESFFEEPAVREVVRYLHLVRSLASDNLLAAFNFPQTLADELTVLQLQHLADVHRMSLAELARRGDSFPELSPLTRANLASFMRLFDEELVPRSEGSAASAVTALFDLFEQRRSPFLAEEFRAVRDAGAFLRFAEAGATLRDHLAAGGQAVIAAPASVDGACAAAILTDMVSRYLGADMAVSPATGPDLAPDVGPAGDGETEPGTGQQIEIRLGSSADPIIVRPPGGSLTYSLSTVAWRLAQELLVAHETLAGEPVVVYDLETTGTDVRRDEVVEIGAQRLEDGRTSGPGFYALVRPSQAIPRAAIRVHGIRNDDVQGAELIAAVLPRFLRYVGSQTVVGHNIVRFDNRIIDRESGRLFRRGFPNPAIDTLQMARRLYGEELGAPESFALEPLLQRFGLAEKVEHRAAADVGQTIALFRYLLGENSLQLSLRALPEYLPLVAAGMAAAGVMLRDENLALWNGGRRMLARLRARQAPGDRAAPSGFEAARAAASAGLNAGLNEALAAVENSEPPLAHDPAWAKLRDEFLEQIAIFDRFTHDHSLGAFLDYQALAAGLDTARPMDAGKVTMMTLHNAKGTEFPVVIIMGVEEENLPLWTSLDDARQLAEERRVFYVGLTRARQRLYLTSVRQRGDGPLRMPSRFAFELPRRYVRRIQIGPRGDFRQL